VLRDSSVRLQNPPIDVKKCQHAAGKVKHLTKMLLLLLSLLTVRGADASGGFVRCYLVLSLHYLSPDSTMGCTSTQQAFVIVHPVVFDRSLLLYNYGM
jgi:hypothetical protein